MTMATHAVEIADQSVELSVGEVALAGGVSASAVRFYETHGVVTASRTIGNQRRFTESAACRIKVAKLAQRVGLTVHEIAEIFADLPTHPTPHDWNRVADALINEAETRTTELRTQIEEMRSGGRLCEVFDSINDHKVGADGSEPHRG
jgi:MerR family redox-sensitive transcriptional activator SoxR